MVIIARSNALRFSQNARAANLHPTKNPRGTRKPRDKEGEPMGTCIKGLVGLTGPEIKGRVMSGNMSSARGGPA